MRATTAFKRLLRLDDVNVVAVEFLATIVIVTVALRRRRLVCPHCGFKTRYRYDTRPAPSFWRHLDLGTWRLEVRASLRRLRCPDHGVVVEAVPFARPGGEPDPRPRRPAGLAGHEDGQDLDRPPVPGVVANGGTGLRTGGGDRA